MRENEDRYAALKRRAEEIAALAAARVTGRRAAVGEARHELQVAATWHLRRASTIGSIDNRTHAHGSAEYALGGLDICPIASLGIKAAGALAYPWLIAAAKSAPSGSFIDHVRIALERPEVQAFCVELGAYHRFQHKQAVYQKAVSEWQTLPAAQDLTAAWRRRQPTAKQRYLVQMVSECLAAIDPAFVLPNLSNRGAVHDWLRDAGGRPMFWHPPTLPTWMGGER